ncbi:hypothetical protein NKH71_01710 [Mesorhizobium sp. M0983]|uniref:hypothetical protein n=1 Tax=unclassified Mesorhizobium TaxID=325217 RepID=UPI0033350FEA
MIIAANTENRASSTSQAKASQAKAKTQGLPFIGISDGSIRIFPFPFSPAFVEQGFSFSPRVGHAPRAT